METYAAWPMGSFLPATTKSSDWWKASVLDTAQVEERGCTGKNGWPRSWPRAR